MAAPISLATERPSSTRRPASATRAPCAASTRAKWRPRPLKAPVTKAVRPASSAASGERAFVVMARNLSSLPGRPRQRFGPRQVDAGRELLQLRHLDVRAGGADREAV